MTAINVKIELDEKSLRRTMESLLSGLDARSRDIVSRRYGLGSGSMETLESIGREYGITRERVRQIEAQANKLLAKREDVLEQADLALRQIFAAYGGVLAEDYWQEIINELSPRLKPAVATFYLSILPSYEYVTRAPALKPHWSHPGLHTEHVEAVLDKAQALLKKAGHPLEENELIQEIRRRLNVGESELSDLCVYSLLRASKFLDKTVFGQWGLVSWVETKPRGVGDKAYIVLRRHGKPEHFREITAMINRAKFDHKNAHDQTVHNELIKDDRFVLVGRGLYGLTEWGYMPGTVADIIQSVLEKAGRPVSREELLRQVLKQRMVKRTTVLLGLQDNRRFHKIAGERYMLRR